MKLRRLGGRLAWRGYGVKGNPGFAGEGGEGLAAVADQMIIGRDDARRVRGYSRDHRPDCAQVCVALVVTFDGFPLGYEVFAGNTHDSQTFRWGPHP